MDWKLAEQAACEWLRRNGFPDAMTTGRGSDGGVDIFASSIVVQVKAHHAPVGRPAIQAIRGVAGSGRRALFFSTSGYSPAAKAWATSNGVALFQLGEDFAVNPVNSTALGLSGLVPSYDGPFRPDPSRLVNEERKRLRRTARSAGARLSRKQTDDLLTLLGGDEVYVFASVRGVVRRTLVITSSVLALVSDKEPPVRIAIWGIYRAEFHRGRLCFNADGKRYKFRISTKTPNDEVLARLGVVSALLPAPTATPITPYSSEQRSANEPTSAPPTGGAPARDAGPPSGASPSSPTSPVVVPERPDSAAAHGSARQVGDGNLAAASRAWVWLTAARNRPLVLAVLIGIGGGLVTIAVCEALWGPWKDGEMPDWVALAATATAIPAGAAFWRVRRCRTRHGTPASAAPSPAGSTRSSSGTDPKSPTD